MVIVITIVIIMIMNIIIYLIQIINMWLTTIVILMNHISSLTVFKVHTVYMIWWYIADDICLLINSKT